MQNYNLKFKILFLAIIFFCLFGLAQISLASDWYVDNAATGANNGTSWTNAWTSFANIVWGSIAAGDTIYISGGSTSKTYKETLTIGKSGTLGNSITIKVGQASPHNGTVIIDGDVNSNGVFWETGDLEYGIKITNTNYNFITIDGNVNGQRHLKIQHIRKSGIYKNSEGEEYKISYVHFYKIGNRKDPYFGGDGQCMTDPGHTQFGAVFILRGYHSEISHCKSEFSLFDGFHMASRIGDTFYGTNSIHHNEIDHNSDDAIVCGHCDVYNNTIKNVAGFWDRFDYDDNWVGALQGWGGAGDCQDPVRGLVVEGHADGHESGDYVRVYNNEFINFNQAFIRTSSGVSLNYLLIYNNLFRITNPKINGVDTDHVPQWNGVAVVLDASGASFDNIKVFNNTIIDTTYEAIKLAITGGTKLVTNVEIKNNIFLNCAKNGQMRPINFGDGDYTSSDVVIDNNLIVAGASGKNSIRFDGTTYTHNAFATTGCGGSGCGQKCGGTECSTTVPSFVSYTPYSASNDFHFSFGSEGIDDGADLSGIFTTDIEGTTRSGTFDIGAYEYVSDDYTPPSAPTGVMVE